MFKNKTLLITGGTGTFGNAVLQAFLDTGIKEIRIFSRDEKKQDERTEDGGRKSPQLNTLEGGSTGQGDQKSEVSGQTYKSHLFQMMVKCKSFGNAKILHYNIRGTVSK